MLHKEKNYHNVAFFLLAEPENFWYTLRNSKFLHGIVMNPDTNDICVPFIPHDVAMMVVRENVSLFRAWRIRLGLSIDQIASATDLPPEEILRLDKNENGFSESLMKAARIMNLDFDQLVDLNS